MSSLELGSVIYTSVKPIFKIYFIIGLGFILAKKNILSVSTCRDISDMVVNAILPCLIFNQLVSNLQSSDIKNVGIIFFTGSLIFAVGATLSIITYFVTKAPRRWLGGLISVGFFPNISDLPIAYLQTFANSGVFPPEEGAKGVAYVCIFLMTQVIYQFSLGLYRLIEWDFKVELAQRELENQNSNSSEGYEKRSPISSNSPDHSDHLEVPSINYPEQPDVVDRNESIASGNSASTTHTSPSLNQNDTESRDSAFLHSRGLDKILSNAHSVKSAPSFRQRAASISAMTITSDLHSLRLTPSRTAELRRQKSQDIHDVINEYSEFESLRNPELARVATATSGVGIDLEHVPTSSSPDATKPQSKVKQYFKQMGKNLIAPSSISLAVGMAVAMAPPLKALFVPARVHIPPAPDGQPPLSFVMDLVSYIGAASVPLGLLLLGATIARLQVKKMPPGFWATAAMMTASRLIVVPIIGVGITTGLYKAGWYGDDYLLRFVSVLEFGLPNATSLVYFTAFYTDPNSDDHLQMDCLAVCLIWQYAILYITLPFLITFTIKVSLGF